MKAFPNVTGQQGMELRDYFAAKSLPVAFRMTKEVHAIYHKEYEWDYEADCEHIADLAYCLADAMMRARESTDE
jgi:hypothetical protein